jgi:hypothetical protein
MRLAKAHSRLRENRVGQNEDVEKPGAPDGHRISGTGRAETVDFHPAARSSKVQVEPATKIKVN